MIHGEPLAADYRAPNGWLANACRYLYGEKAGNAIFRYQLLRSPSGCFPLNILYYEFRLRRKLLRIMDNPATDRQAEIVHWLETQEVTRQGLKLIQDALKASPKNGMSIASRKELEHQQECLKIGILLAQVALTFFRRQKAKYPTALRKYAAAARRMPHNFIAPEEGDDAQRYIEPLLQRL